MERIEKLEMLIPKLKSNKKINPLKIDAMEWELRALKAEQQLKILNIPVSKSAFISPESEMPIPSKKNRYFSDPLMLLVGNRKYKGQYNFNRNHFSKAGYHIENYIFPNENVIGWRYL